MSQNVTAATATTPTNANFSGAAGTTGGAGTGGPGSGSTVLVPNPPPALSALSTGQLIRAVAAGRTADGQVVLDTRFGQITVQLSETLQRGAVLQLRIVQSGKPTRLSIVDPNTGQSSNSSGVGKSAAPAITPRAGDVVTVRPTASGTNVPAGAGSAASSAPGASTQPGTPFEARIVWLSEARPDPSLSRAELITGRVHSSPPNGPTIIRTPTGQFILPQVGSLRPGLEIALRPMGGQLPAPPAGNTGALPSAPLTTLGTAWTALEDAHTVLTAAGTGNPAPIAANAIPATGPQLATGMLFFLNALLHGNMQEWLGREAMRVLGDGDKQNLLNRLSDDFAQLSRVAGEPAQGDWRMAIIPLLDERRLHQIRLFFRHVDGEEAGGENRSGTRFVVETSLSRMGALQLDGFVRPSRFDLMVRTHDELPATMREDIAQLFTNANREFGAAGQIGFRVENPFGVSPGEAGENAAGVYA